MLIWQHNVECLYSPSNLYYDRIRIKVADFISDSSTQLNDFFPSDEYENFQCLNDTTFPTASLGDIFEEILPDLIRPAHFSLNGIQKQNDGSTLIEETILHHPLKIVNRNAGGWQAVSVPYGLSDYYYKSIFPTCTTAYKFDGTYISVDTLENGPAYWVNFPSSSQRLVYQGDLIEYLEILVDSGWNFTGSIPYVIPRPNVASDPPGIIEYIFRYDNPGNYVFLTSNHHLGGGLGYWTKTTGSGNIILDRYAESSPLPKIDSFSEINLNEMDKFIITDANGYSQILYVSNTDIDTALLNINIDLPPFFPELDFDSRFEYGEYVKKVSADSGEIDLNILIHTTSYPINLGWELNPGNGINYSFINDSGTGKISITLTENGNRTFNNLNDNRIRLYAQAQKINGSTNLPSSYMLHQNFPNPFNPFTSIKYDIPNRSDVSLIVYDILGRKVKELVNTMQQAGSYEVQFDASQLASGVYIYQLIAEKYLSSKKMILLK